MLGMFIEYGVIHYNAIQMHNNEAIEERLKKLIIRVKNVVDALVRSNDIIRNFARFILYYTYYLWLVSLLTI